MSGFQDWLKGWIERNPEKAKEGKLPTKRGYRRAVREMRKKALRRAAVDPTIAHPRHIIKPFILPGRGR
jgi:hypothetical protein